MKKNTMPCGFSGFAWGIGGFCAPVLLWPMALLLSVQFAKNPALSEGQANTFATLFWIYPFILLLVARILYKLRAYKPRLAKQLLALSAVIFYVVLVAICAIGLS